MSTSENEKYNWNIIGDLARSLTGQAYTVQQETGLLRNNINRRIRQLGLDNVREYLLFLDENASEWSQFISMVTIHTTSWFREDPHFKILLSELEQQKEFRSTFKILCTACSTGQEVYSLGVVLENFRKHNPQFNYSIEAFDIDPVSVEFAKKAVYSNKMISKAHFDKYKMHFLVGKNNSEGFFKPSDEIRQKTKIEVGNLLDLSKFENKYDWIFCRNVLIYFNKEQVNSIVKSLATKLNKNGRLCIGHSESFDTEKLNLKLISNSVYKHKEILVVEKDKKDPPQQNLKQKYNALVIDDSPVVRKKLGHILKSSGFNIYEATDTTNAEEVLKKEQIHFITLDYHMPGTNGIDWIIAWRNKNNKIPVVMVSDSTIEDAPQILNILGKQIQDFFDKKTIHTHPEYLAEKASTLVEASMNKSIRLNRLRKNNQPVFKNPDLILIGASTGGTTALVDLLHSLPNPCPPIVVVQHITSNFSKAFAERLASESKLILGDSQHQKPLLNSHIYLSHGDYHIGVKEEAEKLYLITSNEGLISSHRPSVDFLFHSATHLKRKKIMAILMTGMGSDGAKGLLELKKYSAFTACQNEESCVVFGMPKEAIKLDANLFEGNISDLRNLIINSYSTGDLMQTA